MAEEVYYHFTLRTLLIMVVAHACLHTLMIELKERIIYDPNSPKELGKQIACELVNLRHTKHNDDNGGYSVEEIVVRMNYSSDSGKATFSLIPRVTREPGSQSEPGPLTILTKSSDIIAMRVRIANLHKELTMLTEELDEIEVIGTPEMRSGVEVAERATNTITNNQEGIGQVAFPNKSQAEEL